MTTLNDPVHSTLALLREWQSVCTAIADGRNHVLIRKGGIAEGRGGFAIRRNFFGLLPTLFHQSKVAAIDVPTPPTTISLICQLVEAYTLPSLTPLQALGPYHAYSAEQLEARQNYKPERPITLLIVRPFLLRKPIEVVQGQVQAVCRSWAELPLTAGLGGIEAIIDAVKMDQTLDALRQAITALPDVQQAPI
jgi:hypothetical protein